MAYLHLGYKIMRKVEDCKTGFNTWRLRHTAMQPVIFRK